MTNQRRNLSQTIRASGARFLALFLSVFAVSAISNAQTDNPGKKVYTATCAGCHGENGIPTALGESSYAPDLHEADVQKKTDAELQKIVSEGINSMPAFKASLSAKDIQDVVGYVRELGKRK